MQTSLRLPPPYQQNHLKKLMKIDLLNQKVQALLLIYNIQGIIVTSFNSFHVCLTYAFSTLGTMTNYTVEPR